MSHYAPLRDRIRRHYGLDDSKSAVIDLPPTGRIPAGKSRHVELLAQSARHGNLADRDALFLTLQPRLRRINSILRPWPNTSTVIGIWDHDDVGQEGYLVFVDVLNAWDGEHPFLPYLLSRYAFRLRDRVLRGIGKPLAPRGVAISRDPADLDDVFASSNGEPESAFIARETLLALVRELSRRMELIGEAGSAIAILSQQRVARRPDDEHEQSVA